MLTEKEFIDAFTAVGGRFFVNNYEYILHNINMPVNDLVEALYPLGYDSKKSGTRTRVYSAIRLIGDNYGIKALKKAASSKRIDSKAVQLAQQILLNHFNITNYNY